MMSAIIAVACANMTSYETKYRDACEKAFEAGTIQSGLWEKTDTFSESIERKARAKMSRQTVMVGTIAYTLFIGREARLSTGRIPYVDSTILVLREKEIAIVFTWSKK
jgi:hypothetical protein